MLTLFIRSYPGDYRWLDYSIQSMIQHPLPIKASVLCIPQDAPLPERAEWFDNVVRSPHSDIYGYIGQQLDKLEAYKYVDTEYVLFSDSDTIFAGSITKDMLFKDGLPIMPMTSYKVLGRTVPWQAITQRYLGYLPEFEFMRRQPILHRTSTLRKIAEDYPELITTARSLSQKQPKNTRVLSEFNIMGAYAYRCKIPHFYTETFSELPAKQYWSWSGLTPNEEYEIQRTLGLASD